MKQYKHSQRSKRNTGAMFSVFIILFVFGNITCNQEEAPVKKAAPPGSYSAEGDPHEVYDRLLPVAQKEQKMILLVFGADWCADCKALDRQFQTGPLKELIEKEFKVMKVDVDRFNKNLKFVSEYGDVIGRGIPSIALTASSGKILFTTTGGELASVRKMPEADVLKYFEKLVRDRKQ